MIRWQDLHHSELTVPELYALLKLRSEVFVVEQTCIYLDIDGDDLLGENRHILGWQGDTLVAYARILVSDPLPQEILDFLRKEAEVVEVKPSELLSRVDGFEALIVRSGSSQKATCCAATHFSQAFNSPSLDALRPVGLIPVRTIAGMWLTLHMCS